MRTVNQLSTYSEEPIHSMIAPAFASIFNYVWIVAHCSGHLWQKVSTYILQLGSISSSCFHGPSRVGKPLKNSAKTSMSYRKCPQSVLFAGVRCPACMPTREHPFQGSIFVDRLHAVHRALVVIRRWFVVVSRRLRRERNIGVAEGTSPRLVKFVVYESCGNVRTIRYY